MSSTSMFGVVLWSDMDERKAVIWCEDHGDLAFYSQGEQSDRSVMDGVSLDAGDLIQFDMRQEHKWRLARNPQRIGQTHCPSVAKTLMDHAATQPARPDVPHGVPVATAESKVVVLADYFDNKKTASRQA